MKSKRITRWLVLGFIVMLILISFLPLPRFGNNARIGVVNIDKMIVNSEKSIKLINDFVERDDIDGIVIRINSPGGGVAASQEIYEKIKSISEKKLKPIIASMGSVAASGGYYIAIGADSVIANPGTTTGSIGVIMGYPIATNLLEKLGLEYQTIKSGKLKDSGSFSRKVNSDDLKYFQNVVDDLHNQFVDVVSYERSMPLDIVNELATGEIFTGRQAFRLGLVDGLGTLEDAVDIAASNLDFELPAEIVYPEEENSGIWKLLMNSFKNDFMKFNLNLYPLPQYHLYYGSGN